VAQSVTVSDVTRALEEIAEIHAHLAAREVYRGWRAMPVAASGLVGLAAAAALAARQTIADPADFVRKYGPKRRRSSASGLMRN